MILKDWPDSDGVWAYSGDPGCWLYQCLGNSLYDFSGKRVDKKTHFHTVGLWLKCEVIVPEVENLPDPPAMVLAYEDEVLYRHWFSKSRPGEFVCVDGDRVVEVQSLTVIPHPSNDPELVRQIEEMKP